MNEKNAILSLTEVIKILSSCNLPNSRKNLIRHLENGSLKGEYISSGWIVYKKDLNNYIYKKLTTKKLKVENNEKTSINTND